MQKYTVANKRLRQKFFYQTTLIRAENILLLEDIYIQLKVVAVERIKF